MKEFIMKNKRRLSVILAIVILIVLVCVYALVNIPKKVAIEKTEEGEIKAQQVTEVPDGYTGIYNADDLRNMANNLAGKYIIMVDLDMAGEAWTPIGLNASSAFTGIFEGNDHTISNLTINSANQYVGMFGYINGGTVQNLILENVNVTNTAKTNAYVYTGGIAGEISGTISNVEVVSGTITGGSCNMSSGYAAITNTGGIAGNISSSNTTITNVINRGEVVGGSAITSGGDTRYGGVGATTNTGGIAGQISNSNTMINLVNTGKVIGGSSQSSATNVTVNNNSYESTNCTGGIAGNISFNNKIIKNVMNSGEVEGGTIYCYSRAKSGTVRDYIGGIAGQINGTITNAVNRGKITGGNKTLSTTSNIGSVYSYIGGVGGVVNANIKECYSSNEIIGGNIVGSLPLNVTNKEYAGGLVGYIGGQVTVQDTYSTSPIKSIKGKEKYIGSLIGYAIGSSSSEQTIKNSYAVGKIEITEGTIGGLIGYKNDYTTVTNSYYSPKLTGCETSAGGTAKEVQELLYQETYEDWDFENTWGIEPDGGSLAYLKAFGLQEELTKGKVDPRADVTITIKDGETDELLQGAVIGLYDGSKNPIIGEDGNPIQKTTNENGQVTFEKLEPGTYYYEEIEAPDGYNRDENKYKFVVNVDGTVTFYGPEGNETTDGGTIGNTVENGTVIIRKRYTNGGETYPLQGAVIGLYDLEGRKVLDNNENHIRKVTNINGHAVFAGLEAGTYQYREIIAPTGFKVNQHMYKFTLSEGGTVTYLDNSNGIIYDEYATGGIRKDVPIETGKGEGTGIHLYDKDENRIYNEDGDPVTVITDGNGNGTFSGLEEGEYKYKIDGDDNTYGFIITEDGEIIYKNENGKVIANLIITKYKRGTTIPLEGATIGLYSSDGTTLLKQGVTNKEGQVTFTKVEEGSYKYAEIEAPRGYVLNNATYSVTIDNRAKITFGENSNGIIYNDRIKSGNIVIETGIPGVTIGIYDGEGNALVDEEGNPVRGTTGENGEVTFPGVEPGDYTYKVEEVPTGYKPDETEHGFNVDEDGNITFEDGDGSITLEKIVINIKAHKVWVDTEIQKEKRPESIKLQVKNGNTVVKEQTISASENQDITFEDLSKYDADGNEIAYTISEAEVNTGDLKYYVSSYNAETNTITNTFRVPEDIANEKVSITVQKVWVDTDAQKVHRPANIKIVVKNGTEEVQENTITTEANKDVTFTNLPKYDANGNVITYTVEEQEVTEGDLKYYVSSYDAETNTITNTFRVPEDIANEKISITVQKVWVDTEAQKVHRPANIKIVVKNGTEEVQNNTITTEANKDVTFTNLPKYDANGNAINYTIEEKEVNIDDLKYYTATLRIDEETGKVVITNTFTLPEDTQNVTVTKVWEDANNVNEKRPESIIIKLLKGEQEIVRETVTGETTEDTWEHTFTKLAKYDANGNEIEYTVDEEQVNENDLLYYTKTINQETKEITNTYIVNASIRKVLKDTELGLEGATILLIDEQEHETSGVTNKDGYVIFGNLEKGKTYTYKEIKAPTGYVLNTNVYTLTVNEDGTIDYGENGGVIENGKITADVEITKYISGTSTPVEGAIIGLFDKDGNALIAPNGEQIKARTNSLGKITILKLGIGTYCYKELEAPAGYVLNDEMYTITVNEDGTITHGANNGIIYNEKVKTDVTITKYIAGTTTPLQGAKIGLFDNNGNPVTNTEGEPIVVTTGENGQAIFTNLEVGTYQYKELEAPIGYTLNTNVYTFTVNNDGTVTYGESNGIIYNEKIKVDVEITKYIKGTETPLQGAKIGLFDEDGNPLTETNGEQIVVTTGENGKVTFENLEVGTYKYKELEAPIGYVLNSIMYTFTVNADGTITHGTNNGIIYNEEMKYSASIVKYILGTTNPVQGAVIGLFDEDGEEIVGTNGEQITITTKENGQAVFTNLIAGTYKYKELQAPTGYVLNSTMYTFTVNEDGTITHGANNGIIYNETIKTNVEITKYILGTTTPLQGAEITLYDANRNEITTKTTSENGKVLFENLSVGEYTYKETKAPLGYTLNEETYTFTVNEDGSITHGANGGIIYNDIIRANVTIKKYEQGTTIPVEGAEIGLFDENGNAIIGQNGEQIKARTGTNGEIRILNLRAGTYMYKELQAPIGYVLNNTMYTFTVNEDGSITHGDNKGIIYNTPKTIDVEIIKKEKGTDIPLKGATIALYKEGQNEIIQTKTTGEDGKGTFTSLRVGTYMYKELESPKGYMLNNTTYTFTVNVDGSITYGDNNGIIYNEKIRSNVVIKKYEETTNVKLAGAVIGLFDENENELLGANGEQIKGTTGTEGTITILNLEAGTYKYKELQAPDGYILNDTMYTFVVNEDGMVNYGENNGIIYNKKKPAEPVDPDDPDKPTEPENPDNPDKPDKPTEPDTPSTPDKPDKPTNPDKPNEPTSPNVPVNPVKPNTPNDYTGNLPKTGETIAVLIIAVIALSGSGIMLTYNYIKMKKENK